jgi:predicted MFS family arabinose efflux permease
MSAQATLTGTSHTSPGEASPARAAWSGVLAMTLCVFALVASEFMPISLLTPVATDLGVSEGMAGQAIALSGAFAVVTSLSIRTLAGTLDRKMLLLGMTLLMTLSAGVIAFAPSYAVYMVGRALIGVAIGGFWSISAATAMRLVPPAQVPRALAVFNGGNALAVMVAAPLGSYLASLLGWRGAFLSLLPLSLLALAWQWISLPAMPVQAAVAKHAGMLGLLKRPRVALGLAAASIFFMGQFALFTYVRPFLETVTGVSASVLSMILLVTGIAGFVGTALVGGIVKRGVYRALVVMPVLMAATAVALIAFGAATAVVFVLMAFWGLVATAAPVVWWSWLASTMPNDAEAGGGLMVAVVQLAIALGSMVGGLLFDFSGYRSTFGVSAALLILAGVLAFLTSRTNCRMSSLPGTPDGRTRVRRIDGSGS